MPTIHPVVDEGLGNSASVVELDDGRALVVDARRRRPPPGALAIELGALAGGRLPAELPEGLVSVMCSHGERAMTAASLLARS